MSSRDDAVWERLRGSKETPTTKGAKRKAEGVSAQRRRVPAEEAEGGEEMFDAPPLSSQGTAGASADGNLTVHIEMPALLLGGGALSAGSGTSRGIDTGAVQPGSRPQFQHANLEQQLRARGGGPGGATSADDLATHELARCLQKGDFEQMEVVGQFNWYVPIAVRAARVPDKWSTSAQGSICWTVRAVGAVRYVLRLVASWSRSLAATCSS